MNECSLMSTSAHVLHESLQSITCTGTDNQITTNRRKKTWRRNTQYPNTTRL